MYLTASIVITTKNRVEELRTALVSALAQTAKPEVIVIDDGSTDDTAEMVRRDFPGVVLASHRESRGLIVRRNEAARMATGDVIFSIDDDAEFSTCDIVEQTLAEFSTQNIGAIAIPFVDVKKSPKLRQCAPDKENVWIGDTFIGTAHALRRDVFLAVGGYREHWVHQGEEGDFCLRMLNAGLLVRLGSSKPIRHYESPRRDFRRMDFYGRRNDVLFAWHNIPLFMLPFHLVATSKNGIWFGIRVGRLGIMMKGLLQGYLDCGKYWRLRKPVSYATYRLGRLIKKKGPCKIQDIERMLPKSKADVQTGRLR